jgi:hypothetical protein
MRKCTTVMQLAIVDLKSVYYQSRHSQKLPVYLLFNAILSDVFTVRRSQKFHHTE